MAFPEFVAQDLANYSGRPVEVYPVAFSGEAIKQAILLFKVGTCRNAMPTDETEFDLARYGILAMAEAIVMAQPFQQVLSNPFNSETIGSYSYSKLQSAVSAGIPTGVTWFDMALEQLSVCDANSGLSFSGGIEMFDGPHNPDNIVFENESTDQYSPDPSLIWYAKADEPTEVAPGLYIPNPATEFIESPPGSGLYIPKE